MLIDLTQEQIHEIKYKAVLEPRTMTALTTPVKAIDYVLGGRMAQGVFGSYKAPLALGLECLQRVQKVVSGAVPGAIPGDDEVPSKDAVRTYSLAMITEVAEWLQEIDTRPWKNHNVEAVPVTDLDTVAEEFADILAFLGILVHYMQLWGIPPERIAAAYIAKSNKNMERITANLRKG